MRFFAAAAKGTEGALRDELRELGLQKIQADRGGVHFEGPLGDGVRACYESRIAVRVQTPLATFEAPTGDALYEGVRSVDWSPWLTERHTLAISASCRSGALTHTQFIAQRSKDAIVDQLREKRGHRPSVDLDDPDIRVFVHIVQDRATVYLDLSGAPLYQRGYRVAGVEAPLKETLAAAVLRLSGWDRRSPLVDPMCGSGTFLLEAALWAARVPAGALRKRFGFERWACHGDAERAAMARLRREGRERRAPSAPFLMGSDIEERSVEIARESAAIAGVRASWFCRPLSELKPLRQPGWLVTNPPYGHRLALQPGLVAEFSAVARGLAGSTITLLAAGEEWARVFPFRPDREQTLYNGDIPCRLTCTSIRGGR
jgi:putative N6-adenine-specific DNA methylase